MFKADHLHNREETIDESVEMGKRSLRDFPKGGSLSNRNPPLRRRSASKNVDTPRGTQGILRYSYLSSENITVFSICLNAFAALSKIHARGWEEKSTVREERERNLGEKFPGSVVEPSAVNSNKTLTRAHTRVTR